MKKKSNEDFDFTKEKIDGLIETFEKSSNPGQQEMAKYAKQASKTHRDIEKSIADMQESLDYLRLCIKYLLFDLEATRRENEHLRSLLAGGEENEDAA